VVIKRKYRHTTNKIKSATKSVKPGEKEKGTKKKKQNLGLCETLKKEKPPQHPHLLSPLTHLPLCLLCSFSSLFYQVFKVKFQIVLYPLSHVLYLFC